MSGNEQLHKWVGKTQYHESIIDLATAHRMEATLDLDANLDEGQALPPLWHWLYFHQPAKLVDCGPDGHAKKGGFLPPVPLPRRMWAGGRFEFIHPLPIGAQASRRSTVKSVEMKNGRSGKLCFVTVSHEIICDGELCIREEHDLVYREEMRTGENAPSRTARSQPDFTGKVTPSPELLFRYSALTFNTHKIHYDRDYCRDVEGYPGLVVHGPLTATLMLAMAIKKSPGRKLQSFNFRALSPLFDTNSFEIRAWDENDRTILQAVDAQGEPAMDAAAEFIQN